MFLQAAFLTCLVVSTLAQISCTLNEKFTADVIHVDQIRNRVRKSKFYYDSTINKTSNVYMDYPDYPYHPLKRVVVDHNMGIQQTIDDSKTCRSTFLEIPSPMLPRDFEEAPDATFITNSPVSNIVYRFSLGSLKITLMVSYPECVPIMEAVIGTWAFSPVDELLFFNGYQPSITDRDVFNTSMC